MIPLFKVFMAPDIEQDLSSVLHSGYITQGTQVEQFESILSSYLTQPYVLTLNAATSGITLALRLLNLSSTDIVLTTPLTCMATNVPILANHLSLRWVDVDPTTLMMDLNDLERKLTIHTRAIIVVHWGGMPIDLQRLDQIVQSYEQRFQQRLWVIEDCAHAFGATYQRHRIGSHHFSHLCVFSFQAIKHLTTGDGGLITLPDQELYERAQRLRWYGIDRSQRSNGIDTRMEHDVIEWGYKFHMNDIAATIGLCNLPYMDEHFNRRREIAHYYTQKCIPLYPYISIPQYLTAEHYEQCQSANWLYTLYVKNPPQFIQFMHTRHIQTSQVHQRNDRHSCFAAFREPLPQLDLLEHSYVCIPLHQELTMAEMQWIVRSIQAWCHQTKPIREIDMTRDIQSYTQLLYQMNHHPLEMSNIQWIERYHKIHDQHGIIFVICSEHNHIPIGTIKVLLEYKFDDPVAHIEDLVVSAELRGQGLGTLLVDHAIQYTRLHGCYKIVLHAKPELAPFYTSLGFQADVSNAFVFRCPS